jgi:hypothetical protein
VHVYSFWHDSGVELVPEEVLLGVVGGDPEDALGGEAALAVEAALHLEEDGGDAVPSGVVGALHRLRGHAEHRPARARRLDAAAVHLRLQLRRHAAEPVEPVERHVSHVPHVSRPADLHRRRRRRGRLLLVVAAVHVHHMHSASLSPACAGQDSNGLWGAETNEMRRTTGDVVAGSTPFAIPYVIQLLLQPERPRRGRHHHATPPPTL